jgi:hypothetical protein
MRKGVQLSIVSLLLLLAAAALLTTGGPDDLPDDRVMCDECHDGFEPFAYSIDAPTEVPVGVPFQLQLKLRNEGEHQLEGTAVIIAMGADQALVLEGGEPWTSEREESGSVGFRETAEVTQEVGYGAIGAHFRLDASVGLIDYVSLTVMGPDGGHWATGGRGIGSQQISLDADDLVEGGVGQYTVLINHEQGLRTVSYDLAIEIDYGPSLGIQEGPDLGPGESHTFYFDLLGTAKGGGSVTLAVEATAHHTHNDNDDQDDELFHDERVVAIEVGDEFVGGGGGDGGGSGDSPLLTAGQALGLVSAILVVTSLATSGNLPRLPRRRRVHCYVSYALTGLFFVHWVTLWAGPYGSTLGGLGTGSVMLALILVLAATGVRPNLMDGKVLGWSNRLLHRNVTYLLMVVLVVHVVLNGSHLAFLRGG